MEKEIRLNIPYQADREAIVYALANSGYSVRIEEENYSGCVTGKAHFVVFSENKQ